MINNVVLTGRLTRDIELKQTTTNKTAVNFTLAVNRNYKNEQGEQQADFINCTAYGKQAENMSRFLNKGSLIGIVGRIATRNYKNKNGEIIYVTEVIADRINFLESKRQQGDFNQPIYSNFGDIGYFDDYNKVNPFIED
ncbi:single-strand binding family protein [Gemella bergeri ATCC 700627]|uniref:Single-stranded DNA-binding protein n=1 Tax=Gemella bergeri ATCC 700627 TaxID=1321820 RepID=U2QNQ1_9BACL|nr:single-stranded DNA-binding protein [Gemella bergeri]ERK57844.1 single-strand binding family protein [Gemella bergeri ATCC 700627]